MPMVQLRENEAVEVALRRFKRSCEKVGIIPEVRRRQFYEKPTNERKRKSILAIKRQRKHMMREAMRLSRLYPNGPLSTYLARRKGL